jgi:hypothetical protein
MLKRSFYPHGPARVKHVETHISDVFLAGDLVYKVKKAVRFPFLDYSTLQKRLYYLHEEMRLNRRLAPSVYLGILPISHDGRSWRLGREDNPAEYVLVMRRLPERRMLDFLLDRGLATPEMMEELAKLLCDFHAGAPTGAGIAHYASPRALQRLWNENMSEVEQFVGFLLDGDAFATLEDFGRSFLTTHRELFLRRTREDRVREGHGDLHCEHVCFAPEGIQIFDGIEFSRRLRCCDVASEIGFLAMDIEFRGAPELARIFLAAYERAAGDLDIRFLVPFYKCYRALVRGKVAALRRPMDEPRSRRYFAYAARAAWESAKPFVVLLCGLTGSGKSTLAAALAERIGVPVLRSDVIRKELAGVRGPQSGPYGEGLYSPRMTELTYSRMAALAGDYLRRGEGVILDATFLKTIQRATFAEISSVLSAPLFIIRCRASESNSRERLNRRAQEGRDASDGNWEIYLKQQEQWEPVKEIPPVRYLELCDIGSVREWVSETERFLRKHFFSRTNTD